MREPVVLDVEQDQASGAARYGLVEQVAEVVRHGVTVPPPRKGATVDWLSLPVEDVPLERLVWPCHDIDPSHVHPEPAQSISCGPIHVQALIDGSWFVHDGRHRAIRAQLSGATHLAARVLR